MGRTYGQPLKWGFCTSVNDAISPPPNATNTANSPGVNFTVPASTDNDGTAVTVLSALGHDVHNIVLGIGGLNISGGQAAALADLLIDPAGGTAWVSVWNDIICGQSSVVTSAFNLFSCRYELPLYIKAGSSVGLRAKWHNASGLTTGQVTLDAYGDPSNPDQWFAGGLVETLGNGANSQGQLLTPGNSGTYGSWTSVGSTTSYRYGALCVGLQGDTSTTLNTAGYYVQIGYSSTKIPGIATKYLSTDTSEMAHRGPGVGGFERCDIARGTQMQARATQTASAPNSIGVCIYGVAA